MPVAVIHVDADLGDAEDADPEQHQRVIGGADGLLQNFARAEDDAVELHGRVYPDQADRQESA